ncbi:LAFE_0H11562g1_1 [Lachancea fermentati]|uniref:LAFE_0H11562g1_1 n=1 Tax=Lachancea fermentati TaxID=4955 RepID=A0A1G4MKC2_LACFM|nr:LAFE_0H11562g1_1 [Lachancea fermentati]
MDRSVYEACGDLISELGRKVSADEVLQQKVGNLVPIPFKSRDELELAAHHDKEDGVYTGELVPQVDLKVLHYFATQLIVQKYPHLINCFDETALITLGLMIEKWVEDFLKAGDAVQAGPSEVIEKYTNYRDSPANI